MKETAKYGRSEMKALKIYADHTKSKLQSLVITYQEEIIQYFLSCSVEPR